MKRILICCCFVLSFLTFAHAQTRPTSEQQLTNASVIKLAKAGFSEKAVIAIIANRPVRFDVSSDGLIELKKRGVSEKIILAMVARSEGAIDSFDANWDDDSFEHNTRSGLPGNNKKTDPSTSEPDGMNIFGSSSGSRGRIRSRGGNGSAENDTQTVGSATVRILRQPPEAGASGNTAAGQPKLEKTPTLTNDSVVQLVDAGFTEGTIIRRIELSPAEFDLSASKLAELRRHRVTDRIIVAMTQAMGDDAATASPSSRSTPEK